MLRIKLVRSPIGHTPQNRLTIQALGLRKVRQVVDKDDTPSVRGMIHRVQHLVAVEVLDGPATGRASAQTKIEGAPAKDPLAPIHSVRDGKESKPIGKKPENSPIKPPVEAATKTVKPKSAAKPKTSVPKTKTAKARSKR